MKNINIIKTAIIALVLIFSGNKLFSQQYQNRIDFENASTANTFSGDAYTSPTEGHRVDNDYFKRNYGVTFHLVRDFSSHEIPIIAEVGWPAYGFTQDNPIKYDELILSDKPYFGSYFLTDLRRPGDSTIKTSNLYIDYHNKKCNKASGYFFDIDDTPGRKNPESWTINVYIAGGIRPVVTKELYSDRYASDHSLPPLPDVGDGVATFWQVSIGTGFIDYIEFVYNSTSRGGIGFDNFSFCKIDSTLSTAEDGSIYGTKILDNNCNGIDANDATGPGWTFELFDANGNLIGTTVSNNLGEFSFSNLSYGNYEIREVTQSGWYCDRPATGIHNVSLTTTNPTADIEFINCMVSMRTCCNIENVNVRPPRTGNTTEYGNYYGVTYNQSISLGNSLIEEIRASIVSYEVNYSNPECSSCYNNYSKMGTFLLQESPSSVGALHRQSLPHYSLGTQLPREFNKNGVREMIWKGMPSVLGNITIPFEFLFPKPILQDCCDITIKACIKLVFKDADCNICEQYVCLEFDKNGIITSRSKQ